MATPFKIVSIGSATFDTFLMGEALAAKRDVKQHEFVEQFPLGQKLPIDKVVFSIGGNSANAAVTFARHGFATSFIGKISDDLPGQEILKTFKAENINTKHMTCELEGMTSFSTILLAPSGERTILTYHGTSHNLKPADVKAEYLAGADWVYMSSLPADLKLLAASAQLSQTSHLKIAYNPGSRELAQAARLKSHLSGIYVLIGNHEELAKLFGGDSPLATIKLASKACPIVVLTDGPRGAWVSDGAQVWQLGVYKNVKIIDRTGAGDAFGSGFVAMLASGHSIQEALSFAAANATSVVQQVGSQAGILHAHSKWQLMPIKIHQL